MNQKSKGTFIILLTIALVVGASVALAKNDNAEAQSQKSKDKTVNIKNFEKPDKTSGETNSQINKDKSEEVTKNLKEIADEEKNSGNTEVSNQILQVVTEQEQTQEQTTKAIEQVEKRGKVKTFLIGTDYKNLGQLRSSLVQNRNQIRKLTQAIGQIQEGGDTALLQEQLAELMLERERIKSIIQTNESSFSLFGWVARFLNNYEQTPINEQEEADLTEEVEDAINTDPVENQEITEEVAPTSTTVTETVPTQ